MTREDARYYLRSSGFSEEQINTIEQAFKQEPCADWYDVPSDEMTLEQARQAVKDLRKKLVEYLDQEPCDAINRQAVNTLIDELERAINDERCCISRGRSTATIMRDIRHLPPVMSQPKTGHCKDCKYFEYDSVANVDGIPLIVAHEICSKWGDGCKTKEDGYCFLFEPQESEE